MYSGQKPNHLTYRKKGKGRVPLVITYSKQLPDIRKIIKTHLNLLHKSDRMKTIVKAPPLVAFRRDRNLGEILVHGKHNKVFKSTEENTNADYFLKKCKICLRILNDSIIKGTDQTDITVKNHDACQTWNTVYGINECLLT